MGLDIEGLEGVEEDVGGEAVEGAVEGYDLWSLGELEVRGLRESERAYVIGDCVDGGYDAVDIAFCNGRCDD